MCVCVPNMNAHLSTHFYISLSICEKGFLHFLQFHYYHNSKHHIMHVLMHASFTLDDEVKLLYLHLHPIFLVFIMSRFKPRIPVAC